eukprot:scaffold106242_cov63-Phaeocystis_antarctica.AAC.3
MGVLGGGKRVGWRLRGGCRRWGAGWATAFIGGRERAVVCRAQRDPHCGEQLQVMYFTRALIPLS